MGYKRYYQSRDPYWTKARFTSQCCKCGAEIKKGQEIFYYPNGRHVYCQGPCGQAAYDDFRNMAQQEAYYAGRYDEVAEYF